ncbi:type II toxin-antitoxin system PemK/MazF family toxin [Candidatus Saccharibacteria bacterium]|nr:type II toxin-antitoxin system PemK/MazF family toxin [Candidatus Saccharibacteria bacterium]
MNEAKKDFDGWIKVKSNVHFSGRIPDIKDGEVWWCAVGENVGIEINGKSNVFSRPVLIFKKLSRFGFLGVPLTSKKHVGSWYVQFEYHGKLQYASLAQIRIFSVSRLYEKVGMIPDSDLRKVREGFRALYF